MCAPACLLASHPARPPVLPCLRCLGLCPRHILPWCTSCATSCRACRAQGAHGRLSCTVMNSTPVDGNSVPAVIQEQQPQAGSFSRSLSAVWPYWLPFLLCALLAVQALRLRCLQQRQRRLQCATPTGSEPGTWLPLTTRASTPTGQRSPKDLKGMRRRARVMTLLAAELGSSTILAQPLLGPQQDARTHHLLPASGPAIGSRAADQLDEPDASWQVDSKVASESNTSASSSGRSSSGMGSCSLNTDSMLLEPAEMEVGDVPVRWTAWAVFNTCDPLACALAPCALRFSRVFLAPNAGCLTGRFHPACHAAAPERRLWGPGCV